MITAIMMAAQLASATPALQAQPADWSQDDPSQQVVVTDFYIEQTETE